MLARLRGRQVAAHPGALRTGERRLDQKEVGALDELAEFVAGARVCPVCELALAVLRGHPDGKGLGEVRHRAELEAQRPDLGPGRLLVLLELEGALDQVLVSPRAHHTAEGLAGPR